MDRESPTEGSYRENVGMATKRIGGVYSREGSSPRRGVERSWNTDPAEGRFQGTVTSLNLMEDVPP
jgi:hypothetical protein